MCGNPKKVVRNIENQKIIIHKTLPKKVVRNSPNSTFPNFYFSILPFDLIFILPEAKVQKKELSVFRERGCGLCPSSLSH